MGRQLRFKGSSSTAPSSPTVESAPVSENAINFDMFSFLRLLFNNRRWLIGATLTAGILTAAVTLFIPNKYTSHATLLPSKSGGALSALKGITGMSVLDIAGGFGSGGESSSELFPTTLNSARLRNTILRKRFVFSSDGQDYDLTMQQYLEEDNLDRARKALAKIIGASTEFKTGVVTLNVTTKYPELSALVGQAFIDELDSFNRTQRKTRATEYENFLRERLEVSENELKSAEDALEEYQIVNRDWALSNDPALQKGLLIRKRDLEIKLKTFALLTQQHEIAKSESRKDLPVVQALDSPSVPLIKSAPQRTLTVVFAMLIASVFGVGFIIIRESLKTRIADPKQDSWRKLSSDINSSYPRLAKRFANVAPGVSEMSKAVELSQETSTNS
jgi:uncharacterized protein involved in exopolysaccharide biosynthesis